MYHFPVKDTLQNTALIMSVSSLLCTERHYLITACLTIVCIVLSISRRNMALPALLALSNYTYVCVSGGFAGGILLALGYKGKARSRTALLVSGSIFMCATVWLISNYSSMNSTTPFKLSWWFELVLYILVGLSCSRFMEQAC